MKGVIAVALKKMIVEKFGEDKWKDILVKAGISRKTNIAVMSNLDDQVVLKIIDSACDVLNMSRSQIADTFGDFWINKYAPKIYSIYYKECKTAKDFLLKMDSVHVQTTKTLAGAHPPRFEYEWKNEKVLIMKYKSKRNLIDFMIGLIKGVGKYYNEKLVVNKIGTDKVEIRFP